MISFHATKRLIAVCMALVVSLFVCVAAYADDDLSDDSLPSSSSSDDSDSIPDASSDDESAPSNDEDSSSSDSTPPDASSGGDTDDSEPEPAPDADSSSQVALPPSSETPVPDEPPPDDTLAPEPEYTIGSALEFLADNGISLLDSSIIVSPADAEEVGNDIEIPNFPGMHRVYLGTTNGASVKEIEVYRILPDLYTRLTVDNFAFLPYNASTATISASISPTSNVSYNSSTGILTCPLVFYRGSPRSAYFRFDVYCFYNDSLPETPADVSAETVWTVKDFELGADVELPNFPGLHRRSLYGNAWSNIPVTLSFTSDFPDLYSSFSAFNFCMNPGYCNYKESLSSYTKPFFSYNSATGDCLTGTYTSSIFDVNSTSKNKYATHNYYAFLFYNIPEEMEGVEIDPLPPDPPTPDEPGDEDDPPPETVSVHSFWDTDFADFTVSEGLLFLVFCLVAIFGVIKIFR